MKLFVFSPTAVKPIIINKNPIDSGVKLDANPVISTDAKEIMISTYWIELFFCGFLSSFFYGNNVFF